MRFNILTVDEFGMTSLELSNMLKNFNVYINNVKDADEAETAFKDRKISYNAIIWAMNSVAFSVFEEIRYLKTKEEFKSIPIVIISKFTDKRYIIKAIESGAVEYIAKPYNEETIINKLCRVLGIQTEKSNENLLDDDIITYSFKEMFNKELKAASRGGYSISLVIATILPQNNEEKIIEEKCSLVNLINRVVKNNLRETDSSFIYKNENIMMLLPFSTKEGANAIENKLKLLFENNSMIRKKNEGYGLVTASVTYPDDGKIKHVLFKKLEEVYEKIIIEKKKTGI